MLVHSEYVIVFVLLTIVKKEWNIKRVSHGHGYINGFVLVLRRETTLPIVSVFMKLSYVTKKSEFRFEEELSSNIE